MAQRIIVYGFPIAADEGADEQQEGRLRLVKIRNQLVHDAEGVAGFDHDLRGGMEGLLTGGLQVINDRLQGFFRGEGVVFLVGFELGYMDLVYCLSTFDFGP